MEEHFLAEHVEGKPEFRAAPWYNRHGDCIVFQVADEAIVADRIDDVLTLYRSAIDNRPIGFQIQGVATLVEKFGLDGLACEATVEGKTVQRISVAALLLAAYEEGSKTIGRRLSYATAIEHHVHDGIRADELVSA